MEADMDTPEILYAAAGRTVIALDRFNGRPVWRVKLPRMFGGNISMILPNGNEVYVARGGYLYCMDRFTGSVLWERGTDASGGITLLAVADGNAQQQASSSAAAAAAAQAAMVMAGTTAAVVGAAAAG
jgi:outer membrane protein assembly factor BamB